MERYDSALLGILQNEGKIAPFLDSMFGFLYRRTDFFRIMKSDNDKLGFPPGFAKKLIGNIFSKYEMQALQDMQKMEETNRTSEAKKAPEKDSSSSLQDFTNSSTGTDKINVSSPDPVSQIEPADERGVEVKDSETPSCKEIKTSPESRIAESRSSVEDKSMKGPGNEDEKEDPEQALQRRLLQANPLTYNGAERENYFWSQTITETDLRVKIPAHIKKGKQLRVGIAKKHIKVSHQTEEGSWSTVVDDAMAWEVDTEESMWTLMPGEFVHINLEKKEERWWECVFVDEPKINTRKIDCSRPMADLDDEAQAKIEEMMYNQRQKELGLPQSHEQKTHEMLRKAWDAEGSPFKGQPFDPSKLNIDSNGVINMNQ